MKFRELSYKIKDEVFGPNSVIGVEYDGYEIVIKFIKRLNSRKFYTCTMRVPADDVEVVVGGNDESV